MGAVYSFLIKNKEIIKKVVPIGFLRKCKNRVIRYKIDSYRARPIQKEAFRAMPAGVNLIGDIRVEIGLGQSMRLIANSLTHSNQDFCVVDVPLNVDIRRNDHSWDHKMSAEPIHRVNLIHINPQEMGFSYLRFGKDTLKNRYNIGFWLWELEEVPPESLPALKFVNEIWTPSEFTSNSFRRVTDKPVFTIPYHVVAESDPRYTRRHFGLPEDKFLYLIMFDYNSTLLRKNPQAAISAFRQAFSPEDQDVGLVIKVNNATAECMATLKELLAEYTNVYYITHTLDRAEVNSLIEAVDVFVSLHRAEGFGLVMAEAMLLKTACIATNWSSNTEFMDSETACMVRCDLVQITQGEGAYPPGAFWADPSVEETAMYMKKLKEDPEFYRNTVERAYSHVSDILGRQRISGLLDARLNAISDAVLSGDLKSLEIRPQSAGETVHS